MSATTDNPELLRMRELLSREIEGAEKQLVKFEAKVTEQKATIAQKRAALELLPKPTKSKPAQSTASSSEKAE